MMQILPKSHEQRIADLERTVEELKRIVGNPSPLGGIVSGLAKSNANQIFDANAAAMAAMQGVGSQAIQGSPYPLAQNAAAWAAQNS